jgi:magnesium transporter
MDTDAIIISQFIQEHGREAAQALEQLETDRLAAFFNDNLEDLSLVIIPLMNPLLMATVFELMQQEKVVRLFESLEIQYTVLLIRIMDEDLAEKILNSLSAEKSTFIRRLLKYFENSVGAHMDPTVFTLTDKMTVKEALAEAKRHNRKISPNLFVLTSERRLVGVINLSDLIAEDPEIEIRQIMNDKIFTIPPETPIQSILNHPEWTNYYSLPIVDQTSVFLGTIRLETIRSIMIKSDKSLENMGQVAISALAELYQIGLVGLLKTATDLKAASAKE